MALETCVKVGHKLLPLDIKSAIANMFIMQATQDPQAISNTLAPFMALANTTDATRYASTSYCCVSRDKQEM
jgi:hypothetical protein